MHLNRLWQPAFFHWMRQLFSKLNLKLLSHCHSSFVQLYRKHYTFFFHSSFIHSILIAFKDGIVFYSKIKTTSTTTTKKKNSSRIFMNCYCCYCWNARRSELCLNLKYLHKLLFFSSEFSKVLKANRILYYFNSIKWNILNNFFFSTYKMMFKNTWRLTRLLWRFRR